ncbi:hypothetical protein A3F08_03390 [Candidatus Berkelbacteria bacterium RIFCSPHIGHO2_12_FULL_36_9]|uniref:Uncharacterized protein n=1 Tax=Candidatus Berkelbacteria bacterium RIFCSPHIGHO2_12_FULL_36_9 TaxID=1797469 RepID=A0A1F5EGZ9_9BACT|nr:MAG: hypothetical protein A3F08_03390 [Candidatus Berkelbacteria bacterium RIFCSPHIGHO2_12_FULL_36_9]
MVSNREPFLHTFDKNHKIKCERSVGGVSISFDSIMKATKGTWVAYGGSSADKKVVDENDHIKMPPNNHQYTLRRVWMTEEERKGYYEGFSNEMLWPLCHTAFVRPKFEESDWQKYKLINKRFAEAILEEIKGKKAIVWIQDYQLALVAKYVKEKRPDALVAQFWHIPWPANEIFRICPWKKEILIGLLSNDLFGFHRYYHVDNFLKNVSKELEAKVDYEDLTIDYKNKKIKVGFFPISIDNEDVIRRLRNKDNFQAIIKKYIPFSYNILALGLDRVDYTKGIPNRLFAIEKFLAKNPKYIGKFVYLGIGAPSRSGIAAYKNLNREVNKIVEKINNKFKKNDWRPIIYYNQVFKHQEIIEIMRHGDICLVTPLDDGMNLVAKEYIVANDGNGALVLSEFAGASKELTEAFLINPYDIKGTAKAIQVAIEMPSEEKRKKIAKMKELIKEKNLFRWAGKFLQELARLKKEK